MRSASDLSKPRLVLAGTGSTSIFLGLWHFATRGDLVADATTRAAFDLNGLSLLFAGSVTVCVAWMAVSKHLVTGYAGLYGIYCAAYAWVLLFAGISIKQAGIAALLATAALFAATNAWKAEEATEARVERPRQEM